MTEISHHITEFTNFLRIGTMRKLGRRLRMGQTDYMKRKFLHMTHYIKKARRRSVTGFLFLLLRAHPRGPCICFAFANGSSAWTGAPCAPA